jgi:hypothetical protein
MSIFEELEADQKQTGGRGCSFCQWLDEQPNRADWERALKEPTSRYSTASVLRLARKNGYTHSHSALSRCRRERQSS